MPRLPIEKVLKAKAKVVAPVVLHAAGISDCFWLVDKTAKTTYASHKYLSLTLAKGSLLHAMTDPDSYFEINL